MLFALSQTIAFLTGELPRRSADGPTPKDGSSMPKLDDSLLLDLPPFSRLSRGEIREILDRATSNLVERGDAVFEEGLPAMQFHLLLDGYIRVVHVTSAGEQVTVLHISSGQLFGFAEAIGRKAYPATAIAEVDCIVLSWPMRLWSEFSDAYDGFARVAGRTIGSRLGEMNGRMVELATLRVEQRVARALLRLIDQTGRQTPLGPQIAFEVTRQNIAEMTGTTLHTVSRLLSAWQKDGILQSNRRRITVRDPERLRGIGKIPSPG